MFGMNSRHIWHIQTNRKLQSILACLFGCPAHHLHCSFVSVPRTNSLSRECFSTSWGRLYFLPVFPPEIKQQTFHSCSSYFLQLVVNSKVLPCCDFSYIMNESRCMRCEVTRHANPVNKTQTADARLTLINTAETNEIFLSMPVQFLMTH